MASRYISLLLFIVLLGGLSFTSQANTTQTLPCNKDEAELILQGELHGELAEMLVQEENPATRNHLFLEIQILIEKQNDSIAMLKAQLKASSEHENSRRIEKKIAQLKQDTEIAILQVQLKYAKNAGFTESIQILERCIKEILNPVIHRKSPEIKAIKEGESNE